MSILAIDTALGATSVGVFERGSLIELASRSVAMEKGHAEALVPLVQEVMAEVEQGFAGLTKVAVTVGPGSFTGLRVGISAARGFALARAIPVVGISTLAAYAAPQIAAGESSIVAVAIDAHHDEIYFQVFAPGGRTMVGPSAVGVRQAARTLGSGPVRITGSGAAMLAVEAWSIGVGATVIDGTPAPDIGWVARLAESASPDQALPRPIYIKGVNATPQTAAALPRR